MKSYVLNIWANKIEVYLTRYVPLGERPRFYSGSTLFIYMGSLCRNYSPEKGYFTTYNTAHRQVIDCKEGDQSSQQYYGGRDNKHPFKFITRSEAIKMLKTDQFPLYYGHQQTV